MSASDVLITNYEELQDAIQFWLAKSQAPAKQFIQLTESALRRDDRLRYEKKLKPFTVSSLIKELPPDFYSMVSLSHTAFGQGAIAIITKNELDLLPKQAIPNYAAIVGDTLEFNLVVDPTDVINLQLELVYWASVPKLSDTHNTNWVLRDHPDVYLYGALLHSAGFLKDDERMPLWQTKFDRGLEELYLSHQLKKFHGAVQRRGFRPIG